MRHSPDQVLEHLAEVLQRHLGAEQRQRRQTGRERIAAFLGAPFPQLPKVAAVLGPVRGTNVASALDRLIARYPTAEVATPSNGPEPTRRRVDLGDATRLLPTESLVAWPAGTLDPDHPLVTLHSPDPEDLRGGQRLLVVAPSGAAAHADRALDHVLAEADGPANVLRGRVLQAQHNGSLTLEPVAPPEGSRDDLVLPDAVWAAIDRNVARVFARRDRLHAAGLSSRRGLLLHGPPGSGKTALTRVLTREHAGEATVILAEAPAIVRDAPALFAELDALTPALVIIEDLDLLVGSRRARPDRTVPLQGLLQALDGAHGPRRDLVTIATTNAPDALDAALTRAGRFDEHLPVPPPDAAGRAQILARHLAPLGLDRPDLLWRLAHLTDGATGADLAALCNTAILDAQDSPLEEELISVAQGRLAREASDASGTYL